jgi:hypothetical protein
MFFKKKKKIILEAYTNVGELIDLFPPVKSKDTLPSWYKAIPKAKTDQRVFNVTHCTGFRDLYSDGLMLPNWADYHIDFDERGNFNVDCPMKSPEGNFTWHDSDAQAPGAWPGYVDIKLLSPWLFYCEEPIKWLCVDPTWYKQDPLQYVSPSGIVEFRTMHNTNVNLLFRREKGSYKITAGQMLLHIIPLTDQPWELKVNMLTPEIWASKFARWEHTFGQNYQKTRSIILKKITGK